MGKHIQVGRGVINSAAFAQTKAEFRAMFSDEFLKVMFPDLGKKDVDTQLNKAYEQHSKNVRQTGKSAKSPNRVDGGNTNGGQDNSGGAEQGSDVLGEEQGGGADHPRIQ